MSEYEKAVEEYQTAVAVAAMVRRNEGYAGELENVKRLRDAAYRRMVELEQA